MSEDAESSEEGVKAGPHLHPAGDRAGQGILLLVAVAVGFTVLWANRHRDRLHARAAAGVRAHHERARTIPPDEFIRDNANVLDGVVRDKAGRAVEGAIVRLFGKPSLRAAVGGNVDVAPRPIPEAELVTSAGGNFRCAGLEYGSKWVVAVASGRAPAVIEEVLAGSPAAVLAYSEFSEQLTLPEQLPLRISVKPAPDG